MQAAGVEMFPIADKGRTFGVIIRGSEPITEGTAFRDDGKTYGAELHWNK